MEDVKPINEPAAQPAATPVTNVPAPAVEPEPQPDPDSAGQEEEPLFPSFPTYARRSVWDLG